MARVKIFFHTETMSSGEGEDRRTFVVSQLMAAGAALVGLEEGQGPEVELVAGDYVELAADKRALLAKTPGYPQMVRTREGKGERVVIDLDPLFQISADGWMVKMNLYPALEGNALPSTTDIMAMLQAAGVRWGVREKSITACLDTILAERRPLKNQIIARGRLPVNGENAWLRIDIAVGGQAGKELGDGSIDFRERQLFTGVDLGQLLATKVAATVGIPGVNVYGHEVPQIPGRDLSLKTGEDIVYNQETGEIRAAIAGVLSVVSDTCVKVSGKHVISSDIDFHTGNIDSRDAVEISGSVKPGFKVSTGGDVVVTGSVESARIVSHGNVVIRGGMSGADAVIEADGDVDIPVVGNGTISSKGSIRISREAYYADIRCLRDIVCSGQARVINSELFAGGSITVVDIDTDTSPNSFLAAATLPERYDRYLRLLKAFHVARAEVDVWLRRFGMAATGDDLAELQEELADAEASLATYNVIPGVGERDRFGGLRYACRQKIMVKGIIRSGAVIRIGNSETTLKKTYSEGYFALNGDNGTLEFHSSVKGPRGAAVEQV